MFMTHDSTTEQQKKTNNTTRGIVAMLFLLWIISGLVAIPVSLVCFGKTNGSPSGFLGIVVAMIFGPFYWIYYFFNYDLACKIKEKVVTEVPTSS
jgi:hypothetical protein